MAKVFRSIHFDRLAIAFAFTLLMADTVPHPSLGPGLIESEIQQIQQALRP
jgi:hypothetical protein